MVKKINLLLLVSFLLILISCLGVGKSLVLEEIWEPISYDRAYEIALESARQMHEECRRINAINYPVIGSLGTSKSRGVITIYYKFDPEAGSICTKPPESVSSFIKETFVPHFGAEFYMHIRFLKEDDTAKGVKIEVTQTKGIKKEIFENEMENLKGVYLSYLKKQWR